MNTTRALQCTAAALGAVLLLAAGTVAASAADNLGDQSVDVNVDIQPTDEPGVLAMTVENGSMSLTETGSTDLVRQFTGTLPTVTVTDTRAADEIADGAYWYVLGSAADFTSTGSATTIGAQNLGWSPALVTGEGEASVSIGGDIDGAEDGGPGLVDQELLFLGESADAVAAGGAWSATAALNLRVPADVAPGSYRSVLTLSLFE